METIGLSSETNKETLKTRETMAKTEELASGESGQTQIAFLNQLAVVYCANKAFF